MKGLKKAVISLFLAVCMMFSAFVGIGFRTESNTVSNTVYAAENEVTLSAGEAASKAGAIASKAVEILFGDDKGVVGVKSIFKNIFADIGYVNSAVSFLKLIGVMKDATAEALAHIQIQLENITERLSIMDAKLDTIISAMAEIKARQDFIDRTTSARDYRKYFQDFKGDYCTRGLNQYIVQFESMQIDAMKTWYNSETAENRTGDIDNSFVTLIYDARADGYDLRYVTENGVPEGFTGRYVQLSAAFLPTKNDVAAWNVNTYHDELKSFITGKIRTIPEQLVMHNFNDPFTDSVVSGLVEDVINVLIYRTTAEKINESSLFANSVISSFTDYTENLLRSEGGFDSILKALFFTHSFEYEISDTINELFAELVFETTYYGSFVKDVIKMSNDITQAKKDSFDTAYCDALIKLEEIKNSSLTGQPNYCYLTNTLLYYGGIDVSANASIHTYADGPNDGYTSYTAKGFTIDIYRYDESGRKVSGRGRNQLIGDDAASLISMTLRSNGIVATHEYLSENLFGSSETADFGATVVSMDNEANLPFDSTFALKIQKVIGDYFTDGGTLSMRNMPANTSTEYVHWHRMLQGSLFNFVTGSLSSNAPFAAIALYGEHHWYWSDDESAFMSGTVSNSITRNYEKVCTKDYGKRQFENYYSMSTSFNCILQETLRPQLADNPGEVNPLYSFLELNGTIEPADTSPVLPSEPETYYGVEKDDDRAVYEAIKLLPAIYNAIIIIPSVIGGIAVIGLATFFIVRIYRKKKNS